MQVNIKLINNIKKAQVLTLLCTIGYCLAYFGRINYSAALADMLEKDVITKLQGGTIATVYFTVYGLGQIVNGILADKYSPFNLVTIGLLGSGIVNIAMAIPQSYITMLFIWGLNGYFQSLLWTPLLRIVATNLNASIRRQAIVWLNAAPAIGTAFVYLVCSAILKSNPWESVFISAGTSIIVFVGIWLIGLKYCLKDCEYYGLEQKHSENTPVNNNLLLLLVASGAVLAFLPHMVHGMLKDGITTWAPTYLTEVFTLTPSNAVAISIVLPLIGIFGAPLASKMHTKIDNEFLCSAILYLISSVSLFLLMTIGYMSVYLSALLFALVITSMHGINVLFVSFIPVRFASNGKTSTVSGLLNATAHLGGALSMMIVAVISEKYGWIAPQLLWAVSSACSVVLCICGVKKWGKTIKEKNEV